MKAIKKEETKKISIILDNDSMRRIEMYMNVFKIRSYNEVIRMCLRKGISLQQLFSEAKAEILKVNRNN